MRLWILLLFIPILLYAQEFEFELQPEAFPVEIDGWEPYSPWSGGMTESNPAIIDIDADGDFDFFVGEYFGYIKYFRNEGSTTTPIFKFTSAQFDSIILTDPARSSPCFRDMDADGDLDLMVSDDFPHVHYFKNIGTPQSPCYILEDSLVVPAGPPWCGRPELVDIDDDGDYDLFGGNNWFISYYLNEGTPQDFSFILVTGAFEGINVGDWASPEFIDIDADGDLDLFIGCEAGTIWYYRNDGDSLNYDFTYVTDYFDSIDVGSISSPEFADIDGDGDYDLFVGEENNGPFFYENIGTPEMTQFSLITFDYLTMDLGYSVDEPQVVDINGDEASDIIADLPSTLAYFENRGSSQNPDFLHITDTFQGISLTSICPYFVDIDADTDYDLFCGQADIPGPPPLALYINYGTPQQPSIQLFDPQFVTNPNFWVFIVPGLVDIDADGDYDLFISDNDGHFFFYRNDGDSLEPNFTYVDSQWQGIQFSYPYDGSKGFSFADLDEDGDLDLLMTSANPVNLSFYRNEGNPLVANMVLETEEFLIGYSIYTPYPYLVDIDSDSDMDLFIGELNGGIMFFRNVTGEPAVPPLRRHPQAGLHLSLGPNPANPVTWVTFHLPAPQRATLAVYNLLGQKVATLAQGLQPPGTHTYLWNAAGFSSGVYVIRLETPSYLSAQQIVVLK